MGRHMLRRPHALCVAIYIPDFHVCHTQNMQISSIRIPFHAIILFPNPGIFVHCFGWAACSLNQLLRCTCRYTVRVLVIMLIQAQMRCSSCPMRADLALMQMPYSFLIPSEMYPAVYPGAHSMSLCQIDQPVGDFSLQFGRHALRHKLHQNRG